MTDGTCQSCRKKGDLLAVEAVNDTAQRGGERGGSRHQRRLHETLPQHMHLPSKQANSYSIFKDFSGGVCPLKEIFKELQDY